MKTHISTEVGWSLKLGAESWSGHQKSLYSARGNGSFIYFRNVNQHEKNEGIPLKQSRFHKKVWTIWPQGAACLQATSVWAEVQPPLQRQCFKLATVCASLGSPECFTVNIVPILLFFHRNEEPQVSWGSSRPKVKWETGLSFFPTVWPLWAQPPFVSKNIGIHRQTSLDAGGGGREFLWCDVSRCVFTKTPGGRFEGIQQMPKRGPS